MGEDDRYESGDGGDGLLPGPATAGSPPHAASNMEFYAAPQASENINLQRGKEGLSIPAYNHGQGLLPAQQVYHHQQQHHYPLDGGHPHYQHPAPVGQAYPPATGEGWHHHQQHQPRIRTMR